MGPAAVNVIEALAMEHTDWGEVEILTDYQLQIEFVTDLAGRERIIFVDAAASGLEPFSFGPLQARQDASISTHALSPAALLSVYREFHDEDAPPAFLLGIHGYDFDLGARMTPAACRNLDAALAMLEEWLGKVCLQAASHP